MKRVKLFIIFLTFTFLLCGCGKNGGTSNNGISLPITVSAQLEGSNSPFTAEITENEAVVSFDEGHVLSGTVLTFTPEGNRARVGSVLDREIKNGVFPAQEAFIKAIRALSTVKKIETKKSTLLTK